jgi:hypothetical protein
MAVGIRFAHHATPMYLLKVTLTSPENGCSVGIICFAYSPGIASSCELYHPQKGERIHLVRKASPLYFYIIRKELQWTGSCAVRPELRVESCTDGHCRLGNHKNKLCGLVVRKRAIPTERPPLVGEFQCQLLWIEGCRFVSAT